LQRIIAQKDEELKMFRDNAAKLEASQAKLAASSGIASLDSDSTEAKIATLSAKREAWEAERQRLVNSMSDDQATIAIDPADLPVDALDQTVRIEPEQASELKDRLSRRQDDSHEHESDRTLTLDDDQTMLLDEHHRKPKKPGDDDQ